MSLKYYRNIKTGETGYIDVKEPVQYETKLRHTGGGGRSASYNFKNFALHTVIAAITGFIAASILDSAALGIIIGMVSFVICIIVHLIKEGELFESYVHKDNIVKQIFGYIVTIGAAIIISLISYSFLDAVIATVITLAALVAAILIIKKIDD